MSNSTTLLDTISSSQAQKEVTANAMFDATSQAMLFGRRASTTTALTWGFYGGAMWVDGVLTSISNGTVALTGSTTNYVEATRAGVVSKNTTGFTAGQIPLYEVVTGASSVTSYTDRRIPNTQFTGRLSKSVAGSSDVTLTAAEARNNIFVFTGALTGNINVIVPAGAQQWTVFNSTSGSFTLTVKTSGGTGTAVTQGKKAILHSDGTNVVSSFDEASGSFSGGAGTYTTGGATYANAGHPAGGRLTLTAGTPVLSSSVSASTSVYYALYKGNHIALYDGTDWVTHEFAELTNTTTDNTKNPAAVANNSNYDLFVWNDSGTLRLGRGPAWTSDTGRGTGAGTTELERVDGVLVNKIAITNGPSAQRGRYVGTVRSNGTATIDFIFGAIAANGTAGFFNVWNMYNRVCAVAVVGDTTDSWTLAATSTRAANNSTTMRVSFVCGLAEDCLDAYYAGNCAGGAGGGQAAQGIGYDSVTTFSGHRGYNSSSTSSLPVSGRYATSALGFHFFQALESAEIAGTSTFIGDANVAYHQNALIVKGMF